MLVYSAVYTKLVVTTTDQLEPSPQKLGMNILLLNQPISRRSTTMLLEEYSQTKASHIRGMTQG